MNIITGARFTPIGMITEPPSGGPITEQKTLCSSLFDLFTSYLKKQTVEEDDEFVWVEKNSPQTNSNLCCLCHDPFKEILTYLPVQSLTNLRLTCRGIEESKALREVFARQLLIKGSRGPLALPSPESFGGRPSLIKLVHIASKSIKNLFDEPDSSWEKAEQNYDALIKHRAACLVFGFREDPQSLIEDPLFKCFDNQTLRNKIQSLIDKIPLLEGVETQAYRLRLFQIAFFRILSRLYMEEILAEVTRSFLEKNPSLDPPTKTKLNHWAEKFITMGADADGIDPETSDDTTNLESMINDRWAQGQQLCQMGEKHFFSSLGCLLAGHYYTVDQIKSILSFCLNDPYLSKLLMGNLHETEQPNWKARLLRRIVILLTPSNRKQEIASLPDLVIRSIAEENFGIITRF